MAQMSSSLAVRYQKEGQLNICKCTRYLVAYPTQSVMRSSARTTRSCVAVPPLLGALASCGVRKRLVHSAGAAVFFPRPLVAPVTPTCTAIILAARRNPRAVQWMPWPLLAIDHPEKKQIHGEESDRCISPISDRVCCALRRKRRRLLRRL
jgi:hypothetical protein